MNQLNKAEPVELFKSAKFGEVRTMVEDNQVYFCGKDVATALGYTNPGKAIRDHCKGGTKWTPLPTDGGTQKTRFISEPDVYRLIAHSKLPAAEQFEAWIFEEVLPAIRRHGMYATEAVVERMLQDPDTMIHALQALKAEREARKALEAEAAVNRPKVIFADAVATSHSEILVGELAKILRGNGIKIGQNRLFEWMRTFGWLINGKRSDRNMPTQKAMEMGLFKVKETAVTHSDGHVTVSKTPKVTGKGQQFFIDGFLSGRFTIDQCVQPELELEEAVA